MTRIIYSASGCWTPDYKLGQLTLTGSNPLSASSWTKKWTPVFQRNDAGGLYARAQRVLQLARRQRELDRLPRQRQCERRLRQRADDACAEVHVELGRVARLRYAGRARDEPVRAVRGAVVHIDDVHAHQSQQR